MMPDFPLDTKQRGVNVLRTMRPTLRTLLAFTVLALSAPFAIAQEAGKAEADAAAAAKETLQKLFAPSNSSEQLAELAAESGVGANEFVARVFASPIRPEQSDGLEDI